MKIQALRITARLATSMLLLVTLTVIMGTTKASADALDYPDAGKHCIWYPYSAGDFCKHNGAITYEWGDNHDDESGANIYSGRGYAYRNCTDYVAWKLQSLGVPDNLTRGLGNGGQWYDNAASKIGLDRGSKPKVGAAAVVPWDTKGFGGFGHVAYVEAVNADGTITVSEYNFNLDGTGSTRTVNPTTAHFTEFVYFGPHMTNQPSSGGSSDALADGKFINHQGNVYRIAGGAPLYVSGDDAARLPDWTTNKPVTDAEWASLRAFPADGMYMRDVQTGAVYVTVGGAPMYISGDDAPYLPNWARALPVPHWDFVNWQHLRQYPADGYYLRDVQSGFVYNTAGGAPFYVTAQDAPALPQWQYATNVPHWELMNHLHLRTMPADGAYITDVETGAAYITLGGAPMYVSGDDAPFLPNWAGATRVSHWEFQNWSSLRPFPADGYYLRDVQSGFVYNTAGGAPLYVSAQDAAWLPQWHYASPVPHWELQNWGHLKQLPADGTFVKGAPSGEVFRVMSGVATRVITDPLPAATTVDDWAIANQLGGTL